MPNKTIVDLGCGNRKYPGSIGIDRIRLENVDVVADLNLGIPLKDNSVDMIFSSHYIEHAKDVLTLIEEIHRVLKPSGIAEIRVPYFNCFDAFTDPTHKNFFTERAFDYFSDESSFNYYSKARFEILKKQLIPNPAIRNKILSIFLPQRILKGIFDVYNEIQFELKAIK